jgi:hypothetical protein
LDSLVTVVLRMENGLITGKVDPAIASPSRHGTLTSVLDAASSARAAMIRAHTTNSEHSVVARSSEALL